MGRPSRSLIGALLVAGCGVHADPGTQVSMSFDRSSDFYNAPFPSDDLVQADGHVAISGFPNPNGIELVEQCKALLASDARGFAEAGGVYFKLSADLDPTTLPTMEQSTERSASVFLISVQRGAPDYLHRYPVQVTYAADGGPYGTSHLLALVPLQGQPMRPATRYAAVVLRSTNDAYGKPLGRSLEMAQIAANQRPAGLSQEVFERYSDAISVLETRGITPDDIAGLAVFTTDDELASFESVAQDMASRPLPSPTGMALANVYSNYCVYQGTVQIPDYQSGDPPFWTTGGAWQFDSTGKPILQRMETASIVVTVPQATIPVNGFPAVVFIPAGGGTAVPLVDRGLENAQGMVLTPGSGPAMEYARVGFAGVSIDGPQDGSRNVTGNPANEDGLMINFANPPALRDNIREDAAEATLHGAILGSLTLDVSGCPGAAAADGTTLARFDPSKMVIAGHSLGASVAPLAAAFEPGYAGMVVDGAGASYIENVLYKRLPFDVLTFAEVLIEYYGTRTLTAWDPALTLIQWAAEPSDSQIFARYVVHEPAGGSQPKQVLMFQGIVDDYIRPTIANALTLALGIDLAGPAIDSGNPAYSPEETPVLQVLPFSGHRQLSMPASANISETVTAVLVQDPGDGIEDGHEMVFQTEPPKNQYRCFLQTLAAGGPAVVTDGATADCP